uniref:HlyD family efflux transporter periplasmic adaptor subunit n=1 Tax=Bellilinea caldifistulae TaxID=360411 RepID=A0A7C4L0N9_9CHLR
MSSSISGMMLGLLLTAAAPAGAAAAGDRAGALPNELTLDHCLVSIIDEAQVPSQESGVIAELLVKEGQAVRAGDLLFRLDDLSARAAYRVAEFKWQQAEKEAKSDVSVRFSQASADVARANYDAANEANRRSPNTFSQTEMREKWLICVRSNLEIEKSKLDLEISGIRAQAMAGELEIARQNLERRSIKSPLEGVVEEIRRHVGEWVQPGDAVVHVVRLDRLRIEGFIKASVALPGEVNGRPVQAEVELARGQRAVFTGQVTHVKSILQAGGEYRVWAEVQNRQADGHWLLRPGLEARMTIRLR